MIQSIQSNRAQTPMSRIQVRIYPRQSRNQGYQKQSATSNPPPPHPPPDRGRREDGGFFYIFDSRYQYSPYSVRARERAHEGRYSRRGSKPTHARNWLVLYDCTKHIRDRCANSSRARFTICNLHCTDETKRLPTTKSTPGGMTPGIAPPCRHLLECEANNGR